MNDPARSIDIDAQDATPAQSRTRNADVRGWLLLICLMLTLIGPAISIGLMVSDYRDAAPYFAESRGLQAATFFCIAIAAGAVAFGIYAGLRLWRVKPRAVEIAKASLLVGLAADIVATTIQAAMSPASADETQLVYEVLLRLVPSLIFFSACFAYLNKSARVEALYAPRRAQGATPLD